MNDIKKESFISKLTKEEKTIKDKTVYQILPEYGKGKIITYKIVPGMYLTWSDFILEDVIQKKTNGKCLNSFIEIDYCLDGEYIWKIKDNHSGNITGGESLHYGGNSIFAKIDFKGKKYQSINIFCYLNELKNSVEQIYGVSKDRIESYYEKLFQQEKYLIAKNQHKTMCILNEIYKLIKYDYVDLIKVKAIELFLMEIYGYNNYETQEKRYYTKVQMDKVKRIKNIIEDNYNKKLTIKDLSRMANINTTDLKRCFKDMFGHSIYAYKRKYRMKKAIQLLLETDYKIYEIVHIIGYNDAGQFAKMFKEIQGMTPTEYRENIKNYV
ncbi:helix-turn-helix domain-containing protein [Inediibacterium massiliense]|uniref:helix-turn-helix domain-containing protein n=1 Tax=Inediibacterium massiliense TaxID=1658111 RepID=UPI0006B5B959|nr:AraC family transcriptional regulator [Inediibacterium massiliense]